MLFRVAKMHIILANDQKLAEITLMWAWQFPNSDVQIWSSMPGNLSVAGGNWDAAIVTPDLYLNDEDNGFVAHCRDVNCDLAGYPLAGHQGREGNFSVLKRGGILAAVNFDMRWKLVSV